MSKSQLGITLSGKTGVLASWQMTGRDCNTALEDRSLFPWLWNNLRLNWALGFKGKHAYEIERSKVAVTRDKKT